MILYDYEVCAGILFQTAELPGMVGETVYSHDAFLIQPGSSGMPILTPYEYKDLKAHYNQIEGKNERIKFWHLMKPFSPKGQEELRKEINAEILSYIK
jgi:hypothetical protein